MLESEPGLLALSDIEGCLYSERAKLRLSVVRHLAKSQERSELESLLERYYSIRGTCYYDVVTHLVV